MPLAFSHLQILCQKLAKNEALVAWGIGIKRLSASLQEDLVNSTLREYDTVGIANWFFHENSWFGQFRHALSKYAKKNIPSWLIFRDIYDRISTIFRQIFKIRIFIAVKKISQFQNGKR
jgi:hypothetical protein